MRVFFQVFTELEWWSCWTRRDTLGGSLVCFHCIISVHNKHIISRWTTLLPSHLGWELDCNKQQSPLYRSSAANDSRTEMHTEEIGFGFGNLQYCFWWVKRITKQREITTGIFFIFCWGVMVAVWVRLSVYHLHGVLVVAAGWLAGISLHWVLGVK